MHFQKPMLGVPLDWSNHLNKDLALHLAMNEGHGDVVRDLSMNGNHGTLENMAFPSTPASGWNPGRTGVGLNFDGTDDYVDCGNNASLRPTDAMTVDGMFRTVHDYSVGDVGFIFGDYNKNVINGIGAQVNAQNRIYLFNTESGGNTRKVTSPGAVNDGVWHHFAAVFVAGADLNLYIDGVDQGNSTLAGTVTTINHNTNFILGRQSNPAERRFTGSIDQVRIHNRALTAKEVQDYYINPWQVYLDEDDY